MQNSRKLITIVAIHSTAGRLIHASRRWVVTLLTALLCTSVAAQDIEIYTSRGENPSNKNPNVLFIVDTSSSMNSPIDVVEYDPDAATPFVCGLINPNINHYEPVYWSTDDVPPNCFAFVPDPARGGSLGPAPQHARSFNPAMLDCDAAMTALSTDGFYREDQITSAVTVTDDDGNDNDVWQPLAEGVHDGRPTHGRLRHVECRADQPDSGTPDQYHGDNAGSGIYIKDGGTYGSSSPTWDDDDWNDHSQTITLFSASYANWYWQCFIGGVGCGANRTTRIDALKEILTDMVTNLRNINVGIMGFNPSNENGGSLLFGVDNLGDPMSQRRADMISAIDSLDLRATSTPLAEVLYESFRYWTGGEVKYGDYDASNAEHDRDKDGMVDWLDGSGDYMSPFDTECSANYQIIITDGFPTNDGDSDSDINAQLGMWRKSADPPLRLSGTAGDDGTPVPACASNDSSTETPVDADGNPVEYNSCLDDLAEYMYKTDLSQADAGDANNIDHNISTFTIFLGDRSNELLENLADSDYIGGQLYSANEANNLRNAFDNAIEIIEQDTESFLSPAVSVNALNQLTHRNELYFALFKPATSAHWPGNIKRYQLKRNSKGDNVIADVNGDAAVDEGTGRIKSSATSWWRLSGKGADGNNVNAGGLAERLFNFNTHSNRFDAESRGKVYTHSTQLLKNFTGTPAALQVIHEDDAETDADPNKDLTKAMFNAASLSEADFHALVKRARGVDSYDEDEDGDVTEGVASMGSVLHAKPAVVIYNVNPDADTDAKKQDNVIFAMTNDGYLHIARTEAPGASSGMEYSAFIPRRLLPNLQDIFDAGNNSKLYGLDGGLTIWRHDENKDGNIKDSDDDHVYAYFGMRRGGRALYALDVTDVETPKLLWYIDPDEPNIDAAGPFRHLGQSWAAPVRTQMVIGEGDMREKKDVLIISGGYDPDTQDVADTVRDNTNGDNRGHAIYIVDAGTGELYWWASKENSADDQTLKMDEDETENMLYGFTSSVSVVDSNKDGMADIFYATDNGAQIWRFDINNMDRNKELVDRITGGRIADFQLASETDTNTAVNNRRFYYSADIALVSLRDTDSYLTIAIGSGYRAHPLDDTVRDRFYLVKDYNVNTPPSEYTTLYEGNLLDVTEVNFADKATRNAFTDQAKKRQLRNGWYISLGGSGDDARYEKVLTKSTTVEGSVIFTTYSPPVTRFIPGSCRPNDGAGRAYAVRIDDARPNYDLETVVQKGGDLNLDDRGFDLGTSGIPDTPTTIYTGDPGGGTVLVGTEALPTVKPGGGDGIGGASTSYWYQEGTR